jgi:hypothetical protein
MQSEINNKNLQQWDLGAMFINSNPKSIYQGLYFIPTLLRLLRVEQKYTKTNPKPMPKKLELKLRPKFSHTLACQGESWDGSSSLIKTHHGGYSNWGWNPAPSNTSFHLDGLHVVFCVLFAWMRPISYIRTITYSAFERRNVCWSHTFACPNFINYKLSCWTIYHAKQTYWA